MLRRIAFAGLGGFLGLVCGGLLGWGGGMGLGELFAVGLEPAVTLTLCAIAGGGGVGFGVGVTLGAQRGRRSPV